MPPANPSPSEVAARTAAAAAAEAHKRSLSVLYEEPHVVIRAFNGMLAMVATCLIFGGLLWALSFNAKPFDFPNGRGSASLSQVRFTDDGKVVELTVPKPMVLAPIFVGGLLLAFARRSSGGGHVFRAIAGAALAVVLAGVALGPASDALQAAYADGDWDKLRPSKGNLIVMFLMLNGVALLLFWPRARRVRSAQTIVV
jgi:hypothetical protein